jgi:hypothetical protein
MSRLAFASRFKNLLLKPPQQFLIGMPYAQSKLNRETRAQIKAGIKELLTTDTAGAQQASANGNSQQNPNGGGQQNFNNNGQQNFNGYGPPSPGGACPRGRRKSSPRRGDNPESDRLPPLLCR